MHRTAARLLLPLVSVALFAGAAQAQSGPPLDLEDALVLAPAPLRVQTRLLEQRCVAFRLDAEASARLRAAGSSDAYLELLREGCEVEFRAAQAANTAGAYAAYLASNPEGRFARQARSQREARLEEVLFQNAEEEARGPVYQYYAYQRYLRSHPAGRFAREARVAMERIIR